ncbi:MAG TPA: hypothetical protein VNO26_12825 [Candidatus Limnocylindria bacterium]|nr:hypothetical protein [Candidatus Limnocylindria bacterium]
MKIAFFAVAALLVLPASAPAEPSEPAAAPAAPAASAAATNVVRYADDKVTLDVKGMPAAELVNEIARQAGAKVTGSIGDTGPVTASWSGLPLKDALEHVLGAQNFTLTYGEHGDLRTIALRGQQQPHQPPFADGPGHVSPDDKTRAPEAEYALFKAFDLREEVPIEGPMAQRLGRSTAPLDLVTNTAIADDDPAVRRSGMKSVMKMFEGNDELRSTVLETTKGMTDEQLAAFARAYLYHMAEDFVHNVKRATTIPDVRRRASDVLRELRKKPFTGPRPVEGGMPTPG